MRNIPFEVVAAQHEVIRRFLPRGCHFLQILTNRRHAEAVDIFLKTSPYDAMVLLDIDCVPLTDEAIPFMLAKAGEGAVVGAAQRANHIDNGGHIYAGPFCMAVHRRTWVELGSPSFVETPRGDVGEELTWTAEEKGVPVSLLWPSAVETPRWPLRGDRVFGTGTTYDSLFWHAFEIRSPHQHQRFIERCAGFLKAPNAARASLPEETRP
ncbi:MAG: hypothetical protein K2Q10_14080 [Rhodospirillales bacterium]|nr:hypothetical protein [Rhodospirillales bacterium]